uniref:Cyclin-J-like protein n=1 Tax=Bos mutus grunniens TaxID=30521 RepID=A0A8B9XZT8_BOSMU
MRRVSMITQLEVMVWGFEVKCDRSVICAFGLTLLLASTIWVLYRGPFQQVLSHVISASPLGKFEDREDHVPKLEQINSTRILSSQNFSLTRKELLSTELLLLEAFGWNLCLPTPAHFLDYYLLASVSQKDHHCHSWPTTCPRKTKECLKEYAHYFLEVTLQDHIFYKFQPSVVAAACVGASRICLQLSPYWTRDLQRISNYSLEHLSTCIEILLVFGPHGIPVTVFPKREYKDKPEAMQLQSNTFQEGTEVKCEVNGAVPNDPSPVPPPELSLAESLWTSKPPPLFHEGAPYPPPLFIRDTYNQSIPQPPPRKIKRPKRKMYREEPTSIMNAIKLRPRQVLCDKCKNSVVAEKKEIRKGGSASDPSKYEDKKRRSESVTTVNKKLKTDHKVDGRSQNESQKRSAVVKVSNIPHSRGRVVKVSAQANTSKAQLNTKKVLQNKNMDHAKAREVLKIAKEKAQKKQSETSTSRSAHSKVHFTRRYQNPSSGSLPPRVRLKPQRYRNEENDSSLKTGLEKMRSSKMAPKPQSRCTSTRSAGLNKWQLLHQTVTSAAAPLQCLTDHCGFRLGALKLTVKRAAQRH